MGALEEARRATGIEDPEKLKKVVDASTDYFVAKGDWYLDATPGHGGVGVNEADGTFDPSDFEHLKRVAAGLEENKK